VATVTTNEQQFDLIGRAAAVAGVTESQVRYWVRKGLLPTRTRGHRQRPHLVEVARVQQLARESQELGR
jgi:DNA-binding transcriptional MerR regulator